MPISHDERLVTIATFETEFEASLARGALEAIGIRALVPGEWSGSFRGLYSGAGVHAIRLQVFECDENRALLELRRMQIRLVDPPESD
jgi:hypothetical protein